MIQSFPASLSISFILDRRAIAQRAKFKFVQRRDIRRTGEISGSYQKKGG